MPYTVMYALAVIVALLGGGVAAINAAVQIGGPESLGLSEVAFNWIGVVSGVLIVAASILPSVRKPPSDEREGMD